MAPLSKPVRQMNPEKTRADLLEAALAQFAKHGFDGATVRDIGADVGITHGSIRYHYETKEKLWFAAVDYLFEKLANEVRLTEDQLAKLHAGDLDVFRNFLRKYVHYCADYPEHARIMMQEAGGHSNRLRVVVAKHLQENDVGRLELLRALVRNGVFPANICVESLVFIIAGACQNLFALAPEAELALGYDALTPEAVDAHADTVIALFCPYD